MLNSFKSYLNRYKLHPVELNDNDSYEIIFLSKATSFGVTDCISLIGLNKLTVAIYHPSFFPLEKKSYLLVFKNQILKSSLELKPVKIEFSNTENAIYFYEITGAVVNRRRMRKYFDILLLYIKNKTNRKSKNFIVPAKTLFSLFAFCIKPRPVYTVSIGNMKTTDIFPIDITGNIFEDYYFFSVRKTSPAIQKIIDSKKVCVSLVPFNKRNEVYSLGKHHKDGKLDLNSVNFKIILSKEFDIPVPEFSINVNELKIIDHFDCGVHKVFYAQSVKFIKYSDDLPLAHTPWYNIK